MGNELRKMRDNDGKESNVDKPIESIQAREVDQELILIEVDMKTAPEEAKEESIAAKESTVNKAVKESTVTEIEESDFAVVKK